MITIGTWRAAGAVTLVGLRAQLDLVEQRFLCFFADDGGLKLGVGDDFTGHVVKFNLRHLRRLLTYGPTRGP